MKNPNDIVEEYVADYQGVAAENLVSVIMYGSAVTHEYRPGISDVNTVIVLKQYDMPTIDKCVPVARKWLKKKVCIPFFMTPEYIVQSLDSFPIEFIDMRSNYKILFGEDVLARLTIEKEYVRIQCERELKGIALHLRKEYVRTNKQKKELSYLLDVSVKTVLPIFKALLVLNDKPIPKLKSDIIMAVEQLYNLGISVFSELCSSKNSRLIAKSYNELFAMYAQTIDQLIAHVDTKLLKGIDNA